MSKFVLISLAIILTSCAALLKDEKEIEKVVEDVIDEEVKNHPVM
jgi:hypothetical protein